MQQSLLGPAIDAKVSISRSNRLARAGIHRDGRQRPASFDNMLAIVRKGLITPQHLSYMRVRFLAAPTSLAPKLPNGPFGLPTSQLD